MSGAAVIPMWSQTTFAVSFNVDCNNALANSSLVPLHQCPFLTL
jgi:hypothetical protein